MNTKFTNYVFGLCILSSLIMPSINNSHAKDDHLIVENQMTINNSRFEADSLSQRRKADLELAAPSVTPDGTPDYTDYSSKEYTQKTSFNRRTYFSNLYTYSPNNNIGSCGYVSFIQALSYYDTFFNDAVIGEQYDRKDTTKLTEEDVKLVSPGVINQSYYGSGYSTYYEYCHATMATDIQSKFTVLHNQVEGTDNITNFQYSIGAWDYQDVLQSYYGSSAGFTVNTYGSNTQAQYIDLVKSTIDSGNPIIVHIQRRNADGSTSGHHSVVAYEYDEGGIYANFGWGSGSTHYNLLGGSAGYDEIYYAATLDFYAKGHTHSNNYVINGEGFCGCNISDAILFSANPNATNVPPTIYWMKNIYNQNETFILGFRASINGSNIVTYNTTSNQITISINQWKEILRQCNRDIYISFLRVSTVSPYNSSISTFREPTLAKGHITMAPTEYGFEQQYFFEEKSKDVIQGTHTVATKRYRCGYISKEYIVLSAKCDNALVAYIEYGLDSNAYRVDIDMSLWSADEAINKYNATATIQYKNSRNQWITILDLLKDVTLPTDRTTPTTYSLVFPEAIRAFRVYATSQAGYSSNKGRICIGDMQIYLD